MNVETNLTQRRLHLGRPIGGGEVVKRRVILERFTYSEERVVSGALRDVSEAWWHVVPSPLLTEPADRSRIGFQQTGDAQQKRGLSGTGPAYETDDLAE